MNGVTLGQLRTFLAVVQAGSIRGAATALVVTEPSVSAAITALSRELGVPLTERVGRGIRLTEAGGVFAEYATTMLGLADRAGRAAREAAGQPGHVRVSAVTTAGEYVLPPIPWGRGGRSTHGCSPARRGSYGSRGPGPERPPRSSSPRTASSRARS